jgi:histidine ammonia-lyase
MIAQYTAAALASENKVLMHPASGDSIPTSANQEDHVSMGTIAARHADMIVDNVRTILAIELLAASTALRFREGSTGAGTTAALRTLDNVITESHKDRELTDEIAAIAGLIRAGAFVGPG